MEITTDKLRPIPVADMSDKSLEELGDRIDSIVFELGNAELYIHYYQWKIEKLKQEALHIRMEMDSRNDDSD